MSNNTNVSPYWAGFHKLWIVVAIILFLLLLLLWLLGYGPGGKKCVVPPTTIEKTVEIEKLVDNPELLSKISVLEKNNAEIAGLRSKITALQNIEPKVITKEVQVEKLVDNPSLLSRIGILEKENMLIDGLRQRIKELESVKPKVIEVPAAPAAPIAPVQAMATAIPDVAKLYFDVGSAEFPADVNLSLAGVLAYLNSNKLSKAIVSGFHDADGSLAKNQELAKERAQAVAKLLMDAGVSADRIDLEKPAETTGSGSAEEARRVEVKVAN